MANPLKILNKKERKNTLTDQEKKALRLELQKEAEDVKLELHGK
jgi:hypothetical protein